MWCIWRQGLWEVTRCRRGHEDGAPRMGLVPLWEKRPQSFLPLPQEDTGRRHTSVRQEAGPHQTPVCWSLALGLPASRTVRHRCLLLKPSSLWYFVAAAQTDQDTKPITAQHRDQSVLKHLHDAHRIEAWGMQLKPLQLGNDLLSALVG